MVPRARIELALPKKPDFESGASTNSATPAIFNYCILFISVTVYKRAGAVALERPVLCDTRASCTSSTNSATPARLLESRCASICKLGSR